MDSLDKTMTAQPIPTPDLRLRQLSYSSLLTLHTCPRKFQLQKLQVPASPEDQNTSVTFAYGHVVGLGIQESLVGKTTSEILWSMFLAWDVLLMEENPKQNKSFWSAVIAVQRFHHQIRSQELVDWELVYWEGKPAVELSFKVEFPNNFIYRGFVDAVLQNPNTGEVRVLECKTTSGSYVSGSEYKNSAQAIGYSIVLDVLFPELSSYSVHYLVYKTKMMEYQSFLFNKSYLQRALWIQEVILDCEVISLYDKTGVFPMHGESCYAWYRECEYFSVCTLNTHHLTEPITPEQEQAIINSNESFQIKLTVQDLIHSQLRKISQ